MERSRKNSLLEYTGVVPAGDARVGYGYGTLSPKGLGSEYRREDTFPYLQRPEGEGEEFDEEVDEFSDAYFAGDSDLIDRFVSKINWRMGGTFSLEPRARAHADYRGFATGQRFDIATLRERNMNMPGISTGSRLYGTMVPFSMRSLYGNLDGPALGGSTTQFAYRTGPGKVGGDGTQYGTSRRPLDTEDDGIRVAHLENIPDPSIRTIMRTRSQIKKVLNEI